jgi:hypothetical protein
MKKIQYSILTAFLFLNLLSAQTVTLDNGIAKMKISLNGGVITEVSLNAVDLNPIHEYGHFICFDRWGPSSPEDEAQGIPFHGEASKLSWTLHQGPELNEGLYSAEMSCTLPIVKLGLKRKIYLGNHSSVFKVVEEITNHNDSSKVYNLVQHPTIGSPFLDETTIVDTKVDSGFSQAGNLPPNPADVFTWPEAMVDGDSTDLRYLSGDDSWWQSVVTFSVDEMEEYGWATAVNPSLNLMIGYFWPTADYPWLNLWQTITNGNPFARGLEFGTTGLHQPWPTIQEIDSILGKKLYEEINVGDTITKSYHAFLSEIPGDYKGVESVSMNGNKIKIEEYGLDANRSIELEMMGSPTSIDSHEDLQDQENFLSQNYPNPFNGETIIAYNLPDAGHVHLEVFNVSGKRIQVLVDEIQSAGSHSISFDASSLSGGLYYYRIIAGDTQLQKKMIHLNR